MVDKFWYRQLLAVTPGNLIHFTIGYGSGMMTMLSALLQQQLPAEQISFIVSVFYVPRAAGPFVQWWLIDRRGRSILLWLAAALLLAQYVILAATSMVNVYAQCAARVTCGLANGILESIYGIYVTESCVPRNRGTFVGIWNVQSAVGVIVAYVLGTYQPYSVLVAVGLSAAVVTLVATALLVRETPHFLLMVGREEDAERNFRWLVGDTDEAADQLDEVRVYIEEEQFHSYAGLWATVSSRECRHSVFIVTVQSVLFTLTGFNAVEAFFAIIFEDAGDHFLSTAQLTVLLGLTRFAAMLVGVYVLERFDRRVLAVVSNAAIAVSSSAVIVVMLVAARQPQSSLLLVAAKFGLIAFTHGLHAGVAQPVYVTVSAELLPQCVKGFVAAAVILLTSFCNFYVASSFLPVAKIFGMEWDFAIYTVFAVGACAFAYAYQPETRGKTLVQIQEDLQYLVSEVDDDTTTVHSE